MVLILMYDVSSAEASENVRSSLNTLALTYAQRELSDWCMEHERESVELKHGAEWMLMYHGGPRALRPPAMEKKSPLHVSSFKTTSHGKKISFTCLFSSHLFSICLSHTSFIYSFISISSLTSPFVSHILSHSFVLSHLASSLIVLSHLFLTHSLLSWLFSHILSSFLMFFSYIILSHLILLLYHLNSFLT